MLHKNLALGKNYGVRMWSSLALAGVSIVGIVSPTVQAEVQTNPSEVIAWEGNQPSSTVPAGSDWEQPGHNGFLHIDADNVSGYDGCNSFAGSDISGSGAKFIFTANGSIQVGANWGLVSTLRACMPPLEPAIVYPSKHWRSYVLSADTLAVTTDDGTVVKFKRKE